MKILTARSVLLFALASTPLFGASTPASSSGTPSAPNTSAYTNDWEKTNYTPPSVPFNTPTSFNSFGHATNFGWRSDPFYAQSYSYNRQTIYFPPDPIAMGMSMGTPGAPSRFGGSRGAVLSLITPYLTEFFYAPLSAQIHDEEIPNKHLRRISDYRQQKQALLTELRARMQELRGAEPATRKAGLAALAATMDPRIIALEATAEDIRRTLVDGGFFAPSVDWNDTRSWRLGDDAKYESYQDEYLVMRASAFFQTGLSSSQRLLLRELATDLQRRGSDPTNELSLTNPGAYFSFSPFTARFRLPKTMPEELRQKIAQYREKKEAIKQDLRETIYKSDRAWLNSTRAKAIAEFNRRQEHEIATLETLAEEIREGLATCRLPEEPKETALTTLLGDRLTHYLDGKAEFQRRLMTKMTELKAQLPLDRIEIARNDTGVKIVIEQRRGGGKDLAERREAIRNELRNFNTEINATYIKLDGLRDELREEIQKIGDKSPARRDRSVDQMIVEFSRAFAVHEGWNRYAEYRAAVVEPGLSPAQRRLLYAGSLETLMGELVR